MRSATVLVAAALVFGVAGAAPGYDPADEFKRGTIVLTPQVGGGISNNIEGHERITLIPQASGGVRLSLLPLDPLGQGLWRGSLETGVEGFFHYYPSQEATAEGLKLAFRYHFLGVSPIFPYLELLAGVGGTSLNVAEARSNHAFFLEAGLGLAYFVDERVALTAGYRLQHVSNGNAESPNRGFNSDLGVLGVSVFFR